MSRSQKVFAEIEQMFGTQLSEREKMLMELYHTQYRLTIKEEYEDIRKQSYEKACHESNKWLGRKCDCWLCNNAGGC